MFNINNLKKLEDDYYYYFFRALNTGDINDYNNYITRKNNKLIKIRPDRERYQGIPKYNDKSSISLEEVVDHIKDNHRYDTNCISLSINPNVCLLYGREYYQDKYILVKVKKENIGKVVYNATEYIINNMHDIPEETTYKDKNQTYVEYKLLTDEQIIYKENLINTIQNKSLISALNNSINSLEFIHYNTINESEFIELDYNLIDIFALLFQIEDSNLVLELRKEFLNKVLTGIKVKNFKYHAKTFSNKKLYIIKSKLRCIHAINELKRIINNPKYNEIYNHLINNTYGIEPLIFAKSNTTKYKVNNYVYMNISQEEIPFLNKIKQLPAKELTKMLKEIDK